MADGAGLSPGYPDPAEDGAARVSAPLVASMPAPGRPDRIVRGLVLLLVLLAAVYAAWPVWRAQWPIQINGGNEAWNAYHVDRLKSGLALYPGADELIANNYPPLSFVLIAWLSGFGSDPILIGRVLSLLAVFSAAAGIFVIVRILGGGRLAGGLGAFWYVATMSRCFERYVGMNDPHLVALAVMIWALAWALRIEARGKGPIELPFALMALAGFYKHTLFAIPLASYLWLLRTDRSLLARSAISGAFFSLLGVLVCVLAFGQPFVAQLSAPRVIDPYRLVGAAGQLQWIAPALLTWVYWTCADRRRPQAQFTFLLVAAGALSYGFQQIGDGVDYNSQFELVAALGVAVGMAYQYPVTTRLLPFSAAGGRIALVAMLVLRILLVTRLEPYFLIASPAFRDVGPASTAVAAREAGRVAVIDGDLSCSNMVVCRAAGKRFVFDSFAVRQRIKTGQISRNGVTTGIARNGIAFENVDPQADTSTFEAAATIGGKAKTSTGPVWNEGAEWDVAPAAGL